LAWALLSAVLRFWVLNTVPWPRPWLEPTVRWIGNSSFVLVGVAAIVNGCEWVVYLWRHRRARLVLAEDEQKKVHADRRGTREALRAWGVRLETEYSWVLSMPGLLQQERALQWHDEIVKSWREENRTFEQIVSKDDYRIAAAELGPIVPRMLRIWHGRTAVYQYALAWSDPVERQAELYRLSREVLQLKTREVHEQKKFADTFLTSPPAITEPASAIPVTVWTKPPSFQATPASRPSPRKRVAS
jgi:hypothetical protein